VDNRKLKATGFRYQYTSREAVLNLGEHMRLRPVMAGVSEPYRYEREVEEFLRWSPHVRRDEPTGRRREDAGLFDPSPPAEDAPAPDR
jgi:UDP-glucose 4-epimerase